MNDFADWLSPIIVKELRQGLRSRAFVGLFIILQVFMIFCVLVSLDEMDGRRGGTAFFWTISTITLLMLQPLRGFATVFGEMKANTLELVQLTQLSSWRVVAGKWGALFLQTVLLVCAVLPYLTVRYFLGGIDIVTEAVALAWMLFGSGMLTAVAVAFSPYLTSVLGRIAVGAGVVAAFNITGIFGSRHFGSAPWIMDPSGLVVVAVVLGPLVLLELFELGVAKIAPPGENRTVFKRMVTFAIVGCAIVFGMVFERPELFAFIAIVAAAPVCLMALMEETPLIPVLYRSFSRQGRLGRFGRVPGWFLTPGWASGLLFTGAVAVALALSGPVDVSDQRVRFNLLAVIGTLLMPLAFVRLVCKRRSAMTPLYLGLQISFFVLAAILAVNASSFPTVTPAAIIPTIGWLLSIWHADNFNRDTAFIFALPGTFLGVVTLVVLSIREWRVIARLRCESEAME